MFCGQCGGEVRGGEGFCKRCGAPASGHAGEPGYSAPVPHGPVQQGRQAKSKSTYQLLGLLPGFFGFPGIHNFYAGYTGKGLAQLLMSILSCWILWLPAFIWTIVEVCTVTEDAEGVPFE